MNHNFPEPAKGLGQPVKRRALLKQFGVGVAGLALGLLRRVFRVYGEVR